MDESVSFGQTVRRRRRSLDLTQEELARQAGYSASAIRKVEADSLRPSREMVERLADALRIPAERRPWLSRLARGAPAETDSPTLDPALAHRTGSAPPHNLPAIRGGIVGREEDTAELERLLAEGGLVTVTGSGGVGKSTLALRVALDLLMRRPEEYPDGLWLVQLAALANPSLVLSTIARVLGLREEPGRPIESTLLAYLRSRQCLLILDNCEHLVAACGELAETLLRACPRVSLLATSREPLRIGGEMAWRLQSLEGPPSDLDAEAESVGEGDAVGRIARYEAVALFVLRAKAALPRFILTPQNASAVAEICRRLDGIPLAIELAAARVTALLPQQIANRLDDRFRLLTGGSRTALRRYQTMRGAIDWSYDLLTPPEAALFRDLAVFAGGFDLEAAEAVGADGGGQAVEVLDLLSHLVDKSLVVAEETRGTQRFRLLETLRHYALEKLAGSGEEADVRRRHRDWYLELARRAEPELHGPRSVLWLDRLEAEHDNLRATLVWCLEHDVQSGLELVGGLMYFWDLHGHFAEGWSWSARFLEKDSAESVARVRALRAGALLVGGLQDYETAHRLLVEALALARRLGDRREVGWSAFSLGRVASLLSGKPGVGLELFEAALAVGREIGDNHLTAMVMQGLGVTETARGERERGRALLEESLAILRRMGSRHDVAWDLWLLALPAVQDGDLVGARDKLSEMVALFREQRYLYGVSEGLIALGYVAFATGSFEEARTLLAESLAVARQIGGNPALTGGTLWLASLIVVAEGDFARGARLLGALDAAWTRRQVMLGTSNERPRAAAREAARAALGEEAFARCWAEGQAMTLEQAVEYAPDDIALRVHHGGDV